MFRKSQKSVGFIIITIVIIIIIILANMEYLKAVRTFNYSGFTSLTQLSPS